MNSGKQVPCSRFYPLQGTPFHERMVPFFQSLRNILFCPIKNLASKQFLNMSEKTYLCTGSVLLPFITVFNAINGMPSMADR